VIEFNLEDFLSGGEPCDLFEEVHQEILDESMENCRVTPEEGDK
jgi:hypothetical protein